MDDLAALFDALECTDSPGNSTSSSANKQQTAAACTSCGSTKFRKQGNVVVCNVCDVVVGPAVWTAGACKNAAYGTGDKSQRLGPVASSLFTSSTLGWCASSSHNLSMSARDRNLYKHTSAIREACQAHGVSSASLRVAEHMYKTVAEMPHMRGARREGLVEGAVYLASCKSGAARSPTEVAAMFGVPETIVTRGARRMTSALSHSSSESTTNTRTPRPSDFVERMTASAPGPPRPGGVTARLIAAYANEIERRGLFEDERPHVVAASCVLMAWEHLGRTGGEAASEQASGVPRGAVRRCVRSLGAHKHTIVASVAASVLGNGGDVGSRGILSWIKTQEQSPSASAQALQGSP